MVVLGHADALLQRHQVIPAAHSRLFSAHDERVDGLVGEALRVVAVGVNVDVQVGHFQAFPHPFVAGHEDGL